MNVDIADTLRTHIHDKVRWAQDYRPAVDSVLNTPNLNDPNSPTPYIEFADVSRINDGPVSVSYTHLTLPTICSV